MTTNGPIRDLGQITLTVLAVLGLLVASVYVLLPFVPAIIWATTIVVATWPVLIGLQARLGGRRAPAVALMTLGMLTVLVVPLYLAITSIVEAADRISEMAGAWGTLGLPPPPAWVASLPLAGPRLAESWQAISDGGHQALVNALSPYLRQAVQALASRAGSFGATVIQFLITTVVAAILYATGESAALAVRRFFRRLAGQRGEGAVVLAGRSIKAVAMGVVVTAVVQTTLAGIGLFVAGVPHAGLVTAVAMVLCIAQVGPALVLIPSVIWVFSTGRTAMGVVFLIVSLAAVTVDNVIRPVLIKKGADLPLWLIMSGVIGGLLAFGVVGLFVGPVILAVAHTLLGAWVDDLGPERAPPADGT